MKTVKLFFLSLSALVMVSVASGQSGAEEFVVTETGNVGIGTANPTDRLEVNGNIKISNDDPYLKVDADNKHLILSGGSGWTETGATMVLRGKDSATNPYGIELYTGDAESLRILSNGNIGIGLTNPGSKLDIYGSTRIVNPNGVSLLLERDDEDAWVTFNDPGNDSYSMGIDVSDGGKFKLNYGAIPGENANFVMTSTGNVGIGTTAPAAKLDVSGSGKINGALTVQSNALLLGNVGIGTTAPAAKLHVSGSGKITGALTVQSNALLLANVGIGTTAPAAKLHVVGNSKISGDLTVTSKIYVPTIVWTGPGGGPDYVFGPDYRLPTLESIEAFVKAHHHLPEVPSAREMEEKGLNLGVQILTHLKKIEELTLHMIELKSENDQLKALLGDLSKRLNALESAKRGQMN